jgi:hypothetical protein
MPTDIAATNVGKKKGSMNARWHHNEQKLRNR